MHPRPIPEAARPRARSPRGSIAKHHGPPPDAWPFPHGRARRDAEAIGASPDLDACGAVRRPADRSPDPKTSAPRSSGYGLQFDPSPRIGDKPLNRIHKFRLPVRIHLIGETNDVLGVVHVRQDQRVVDMLCDQRSFFPVQTREGLLIVGKAAVAKLFVVDREKASQDPDLFPDIDLAALDSRSGNMKELD